MYRNADLLSLSRIIPSCMDCGAHNHGQVVAAHRNEGKALGSKNPDYMWAALCDVCHVRLDQGAALTRDDRRAMWMAAYWKTQEWLWTSGHVAAHLTPQPQPIPKPPIKVKIRSGRKLTSGAKIQSRGFEKSDTPRKIASRPWPTKSK
jgi:hypothetical protein